MQVINPLIIAGGGGAAAPGPTECEVMADTFPYPVYLRQTKNTSNLPSPGLYPLRRGNYSLVNYLPDAAVLAEYGMVPGDLSRLMLSGYIIINTLNNTINFFCVYEPAVSLDTAHCTYYALDEFNEMTLPVLFGEQNKLAIVMAPLFGAYCDFGFLSANSLINNNWRQYCQLKILSSLYKQAE